MTEQGELDKDTIRTGDFNTSLSLLINQVYRKQPNKEEKKLIYFSD